MTATFTCHYCNTATEELTQSPDNSLSCKVCAEEIDAWLFGNLTGDAGNLEGYIDFMMKTVGFVPQVNQ